ncbi:lytic transglycosylase domain-containing protein [Streptomyces sp. NPDC053048]|uniref:lytic transglycosylase domain-containing protein n=1 Tax=Streptomyces sp. NPDC053048 TaxID=3365694 RepID=UPI0037D38231
MKILRTRAASVSRQGLCTALLVAGLTTAAVGATPHRPVDGDPSPGTDNPQSRPHGNPNLSLPDLRPKPSASGKPGDRAQGGTDGSTGIPATALAAYKNAERIAAEKYPNCHIPWQLVAGIGKVESEHAALGGRLNADGLTERKILGPRLTGGQFARITDTDGGRWDDDKEYDRAVGPTQFIPSTWESFGTDGNGDGVQDPNNIFDAAAATARYLCAGGKDMTSAADLDRAVLSYNNSREYVNAVLAWMRKYQNGGGGAVPDGPGLPPSPSGSGNTPRPGPSPKPKNPATETPRKPGGNGSGNGGGNNTQTPNKPGESNKPNNPGGGGQKPGGGDKPTPPTPTPAPVTRLDRASERALEATAGEKFTAQPRVRALDSTGKPAPEGTRIRFEIIGHTDARFPDEAVQVTVRTAKDGTATAPAIDAGDWPGTFTLRATVEGRDVHVDFDATVKQAPAPRADTLERVGKDALKAAPKASFTQKIQIRALGKNKPISDTALTATVLGPDGKPLTTTGPYFKDKEGKDGKPLRTLVLPKTDKDGLVTLPELFTDERTGTFTLRLSTADGTVALPLELTVTAPAPETPKPSQTPTTTPSTPATSPTPAKPVR